MHQTYSSSVSPFQAWTGMPALAMAEAAWSWVEKMLQLDQVTSAPSSTRVSMRTAMWTQPAMRAPLSGLDGPYLVRIFISPGISFSDISITLRPHSARLMSATLYGSLVSEPIFLLLF